MKCSFTSCNKKISLSQQISNKCKCQLIFCNKHKFQNSHLCSLLSTSPSKNNLDKKTFIDNNKCIPIKIIKI